MKKKLQVFISSTYLDLQSERQAAVQAILNAGHIPAGMELFRAGNDSQLSTIKKWIDDSDVYMLILGGKYGSLDRNTGKSYTQIEYEYAIEKGILVFAVVLNDSYLYSKAILKHDVIEKENINQYNDFKKLVMSKTIKFINDEKNIAIAIHGTLSEFLNEYDLKGWVRDQKPEDTTALIEAANQYDLALQMSNTAFDYRASIKLFENVFKIREKRLGQSNKLTIDALDGLIIAHSKIGESKKAVELRNEKLKIIKGIYGDNHINVVALYREIAYGLDHYAEYETALTYFHEALSILKKYHSDLDSEIAYTNSGIGYIYNRLEQYNNALDFYNNALSYADNHESDNMSRAAFIYNGIGTAYSIIDYEKSLFYLKKALYLRQLLVAQKENEPWQVANTFANIGKTYYLNHSYDNALENFEKALDLRKADISPLNLATTYTDIAKLYITMNIKLDYSVQILKEALLIRERFLGTENILVSDVFYLLASIYEIKHEYEIALEYSLSAYRIAKKNHRKISHTYNQVKNLFEKTTIRRMSIDEWIDFRLTGI